MRTQYPAKILLAWGEAITGNVALRDWLIKNDYPELGLFCFALRNKQEARDWLMKNGHPHLMAIITGIEGDKSALSWLEQNGMTVLKHVALAGDGNEEDLDWLMKNGHKELAVIGHKMHLVKRKMDQEFGDYHKMAKD
ncbi:MAG: hypothetical protein JNM62_03440 [Flavobacteriales bacterium]|nr:hypothetical protein [Flavobacteriales bacterium]